MVKIQPFLVEEYMNRVENTPGVLNVAETCSASISIEELTKLCRDPDAPGPLDLSRKLTYGDILGSDKLRSHIADLLSRDSATPLPAENVIVTQGAIAGNYLVFYSLVGPGDHVVCVYPTYQQLYSVAKSLGAEVSLWRLKEENGYVPDESELEDLVKSNTKLIVINNPNNPTGATIPKSVLEPIVDFAKKRGITILADEVYSPLFHSLPEGQSAPPSILSFGYEKTISTGSMSKAFALAGIRLGWVASRDKTVLAALTSARDYTSISVSMLDDQVAAYALSPAVLPSLLDRNMNLSRTNLKLFEEFVDRYSSAVSWFKPNAGTTALVQFRKKGEPVDDEAFCLDLLEQTKVMFLPAGNCFGHGKDFKGYVRVGYACHTNVLKEALVKLGEYVEKNLL